MDVAKLYYKRTGKRAAFVPMYLAPALRQLHIGTPVIFNPEAPMAEERKRICEEMAKAITARAFPSTPSFPTKTCPRVFIPKTFPAR